MKFTGVAYYGGINIVVQVYMPLHFEVVMTGIVRSSHV